VEEVIGVMSEEEMGVKSGVKPVPPSSMESMRGVNPDDGVTIGMPGEDWLMSCFKLPLEVYMFDTGRELGRVRDLE